MDLCVGEFDFDSDGAAAQRRRVAVSSYGSSDPCGSFAFGSALHGGAEVVCVSVDGFQVGRPVQPAQMGELQVDLVSQ
ncbi:hypothetical protein ACWGJX_38040 [Streptomyces sp. NPDC054775]